MELCAIEMVGRNWVGVGVVVLKPALPRHPRRRSRLRRAERAVADAEGGGPARAALLPLISRPRE